MTSSSTGVKLKRWDCNFLWFGNIFLRVRSKLECQEICQEFRLLKPCVQLKAPTRLTHTQDYLFLEFQDGISRHKKHLLVKFLSVMKDIWIDHKVLLLLHNLHFINVDQSKGLELLPRFHDLLRNFNLYYENHCFGFLTEQKHVTTKKQLQIPCFFVVFVHRKINEILNLKSSLVWRQVHGLYCPKKIKIWP